MKCLSTPANPLTASDIDEFLGDLVSASIRTGVASIDDDFCSDTWADREWDELVACVEICDEVCDEEGLGFDCLNDCGAGCLEYYDQVAAAFNDFCADPDYLFTYKYEALLGDDWPVCANLRKGVDLEIETPRLTGDERPIYWDEQVWENQTTPVGCGGCTEYNLESNVPNMVEMVEFIEYKPPVYITEHRGQLTMHVPVGVTLKFDASLTIDLHATTEPNDHGDEACPPIPVEDDIYDDHDAGDTEWFDFHVRRSDAGTDALDDARDTFYDWDGIQGSQTIRGVGELAMDFEWSFPIEFERHWQRAGLLWAENAYPVNIPSDARTSVDLEMGIASFCFEMDEDLSEINPLVNSLGHTVIGEDEVEDMLSPYVEPKCESLIALMVRERLGPVEQSLEPILTPFLSPALLSSFSDFSDYPFKLETAVVLADVFAGDPLPIESQWGLGASTLPPPTYRALVDDYEIYQWLRDDLLANVQPDQTIMVPRWMVMDDWWRKQVCDPMDAGGGNCWDNLVAVQGSTIEPGEEVVTGPGGEPLDPAVEQTWEVSHGAAGWLMFEPAYIWDRPPEDTRNVPAPAEYSVQGFSSTTPAWGVLGFEDLEEPVNLPPWEPGRTGGP